MLKNLILIEGNKDFQCNNIKELVEKIIDRNYFSLTDEERKEKLQMLSIANNLGEEKKDFICKDEITYILSLIRTNKVILLEKKDANILAKEINKSDIKDNYIILNKFANELLEKHIDEKV